MKTKAVAFILPILLWGFLAWYFKECGESVAYNLLLALCAIHIAVGAIVLYHSQNNAKEGTK